MGQVIIPLAAALCPCGQGWRGRSRVGETYGLVLSPDRGSQPGLLSPLRGPWVMSGGIFGYHNWEGGVLLGISCIEARDASWEPSRYRRAPTVKNFPAPNDRRAKIQRPGQEHPRGSGWVEPQANRQAPPESEQYTIVLIQHLS